MIVDIDGSGTVRGTFCIDTGTFCIDDGRLCIGVGTFKGTLWTGMFSGTFCMDTGTLCIDIGTLCIDTGTLCIDTGILCIETGTLWEALLGTGIFCRPPPDKKTPLKNTNHTLINDGLKNTFMIFSFNLIIVNLPIRYSKHLINT